MQVSGEDRVDASLHELAGSGVVVSDDVIGQQALLLVKVLYQVVVHHGDDRFALAA